MALFSPPLFLVPDKHHHHHHFYSLSPSPTPPFPLPLHSALFSQSFRSTRFSSRSIPEEQQSSFCQWTKKVPQNSSRLTPPNYQSASSSSSSSSPPWQKSAIEQGPRKSPRHDKPRDNGNGNSTTSFHPAPWKTQDSKQHRKYHGSPQEDDRYSTGIGNAERQDRDREEDRDGEKDKDEGGYVERGRKEDGYGEREGDEDRSRDIDILAQKVGSKTGQRLDWQGGGSRSEQRDRDFSAQEEGPGSEQKDRYFNLGIGRKEKDFFVRKEGDLDSRQRDVFGPNEVLGTRRREELSTKAVESLQPFRSSMPSVMPDSVSSHPHHENEPLSSQLENLAPSKEEEETGDRTQERRIRRNPTRADLLIPPLELKRLRTNSVALEERLKIGKLGVTTSIVLSIQQQWRTSELVKVRCHGPAANKMKDTLTDLEQNTGGLVVWRDKNALVIYRGNNYNVENGRATMLAKGREADGLGTMNGSEVSKFEEDLAAQTEMERHLEGLGPRYEKWTGLRPIPIDADLLPPEVPNYKPPFRLLPFGERHGLSDEELTNLRRLARPIGPHFVLGRNKGHQGLAVAILKLWEKTEIVKIAVKKRVQNTNNEMMANQIWRLTGGVLLSRDKFFITFYRGKDFVPQSVASTLTERELIARDLQEEEEKARNERNIRVKRPSSIQSSVDVIRSEIPDVKPSWVHTMDIQEQERLKREVAKLHQLTVARQLEKRLDRALKKKEKAEQALRKIETFMTPLEAPADVEMITEEERFMYRRLGMKMKSTLVLGRRGIFDGVVENMHFHWKHRELVKLVVNEPDPEQLQESARLLENESGGILVAILPSSKGQEIIMYRGKNYQRPNELRPRNLLNKRKAFQRSIEMQRRASLIQNTRALEAEIQKIMADLSKLDAESDQTKLDAESDQSKLDTESNQSKLDAESGVESHLGPSTIEEQMEEEEDTKVYRDRIKKLERLVALGAIYRADPLKNAERLRLRKKALSLNKASQFFVGKSNDLEGLAKGIRIYFLHHALVKVVVKGRGQGTSVQDLVQSLESLTGGVLVSQESNKIIMYRGWPEGDDMPTSLDSISPELRAALEEEDLDDDLVEVEDHRVFKRQSSGEEDYFSEVHGSEEDEDSSGFDLELRVDGSNDYDDISGSSDEDVTEEEDNEIGEENGRLRLALPSRTDCSGRKNEEEEFTWILDEDEDEDVDEGEDQVELHFDAQYAIPAVDGNGNDQRLNELW